MGSRKRAALQRERAAFEAQFADIASSDDIFASEQHRQDELAERRDAALRAKACESKNRYATRSEAESAITDCAAHGRRGLRCYRCAYCHGWHLTSKGAPS